MKKLITILYIILICSTNAKAYNFIKDGLYYQITSVNTVRLTYGDKGYSGDIIIPSSVTYNDIAYQVTSISPSTFNSNTDVTSLMIPSSVIELDGSTFSQIKNLKTLIVDEENPNYSSLDNVLYDKEKTKLLCCAAGKTGALIIPESVISVLDDGVLILCSSITSVFIPKNFTCISSYIFRGCLGLTTIEVDSSNPAYTSEDNILYDKEKKTLIRCAASKEGEVLIPNSVTKIESNAFYYCKKLTSITIPNSVISIGYDSFAACSGLSSVTIPENIIEIGANSFSYCSNLDTINYNARSAYIGQDISFEAVWLRYTPIKVVNIGNNVVKIPHFAFEYCDLSTLTIPANVDTIGRYAFNRCVLDSLIMLSETPPVVYCNTFLDVDKSTPMTVPNMKSINVYKGSDYWNEFTNYNSAMPFAILTLSVNDTLYGYTTGSGKYDKEMEVEIKAIANDGYLFDKWNDGDTNAIRTITMTSDTSFTANFIKKSSLNDVKELSNPMKLYPNPTSTKVNILLNNFKSNTKLSVLDIQGRVIKTQTINTKETKLDVSSFAKGVYIIRIENSVQKLIVE